MSFTLIHLSDLHYRINWEEEVGVVDTAFFKDLKNQIQHIDSPFFVFTGDVVQSGKDFKLYEAFTDRFNKQLESMGIPRDRRIVIPGNHDVDQDKAGLQQFVVRAALISCDSERSFNDTVFPDLAKNLSEKFLNFDAFEESFSDYRWDNRHPAGKSGKIGEDWGVFALNTAICSFGGNKDEKNEKIDDKRQLHLETRIIQKWIQNSDFKHRILLMHHPLSWLSSWSSAALDKIINANFDIVLSGHEHTQEAYATLRNDSFTISIEAPALFSRKHDELGYSIVKVDTKRQVVEIKYRAWTKREKFVLGTSLAGNDEGMIEFPIRLHETVSASPQGNLGYEETTDCLKQKLDDALECYHGMPFVWVPRTISDHPETSIGAEAKREDCETIFHVDGDLIIRALPQFGLTSLGRFMAYDNWLRKPGTYTAFVDASLTKPHEQAAIDAVKKSSATDKVDMGCLQYIIVDNWQEDDAKHVRLVNNLKKEFPQSKLILLNRPEEHDKLKHHIDEKLKFAISTWYLWALDRDALSAMISQYCETSALPDSQIVTSRIISDLDSLNIHRTPLNCINLLKSIEFHFDESPVNRTEVLERVLNLLFSRFILVPKYNTKPDLKDCQFAIGGFCEFLLRNQKYTFLKSDFLTSISSYCHAKSINLEAEVLFNFLVNENILMVKDESFAFRFSFWLLFFAAHRMRHSEEFRDFILENRRYAYCPELIEFYSGIDRHRKDLIEKLTLDLRELNDNLVTRSNIPEDFQPFNSAKWNSNPDEIRAIEAEISKSAENSSLPSVVKNQIADRTYNRAAAYKQKIDEFLQDVSFRHTVAVMEAASRALRNSEHVDTEDKMALLKEIFRTWKKVVQLGVILCPALAERGQAAFDGISIVIMDMDPNLPHERKYYGIVSAIPRSVCMNFHQDLFSRKNGPLFMDFLTSSDDSLSQLMCSHLLMVQRPKGWIHALESYIASVGKNSFSLHDVLNGAGDERRVGFISSRESDSLKTIMATALAKHLSGQDRPGIMLVNKTAKERIKDD